MKPSTWLSPLVFLAGYWPLVLILMIRDFDPSIPGFRNPVFAGTLGILSAVSVLLSIAALGLIRDGQPIRVIKAKDGSGRLVEYALPYIVSFLDVSLEDGKSVVSLGIFMAVLYVVALKTQALFMNPMLLLASYRLYEAELSDGAEKKNYLIFTRMELQKGAECRAQLFADGMLFVPETNERRRKRRDPRGQSPATTVEAGEFRERPDDTLGRAPTT